MKIRDLLEGGSIKLVIVSTSDHCAIRHVLKDVPESDLTLTSTRTVDDLALIVSNANIVVLSYFIPKNNQEKVLASIVLAVKTAEYLATGLPILVNRHCGGAATVVVNNGLGIAYDPETFAELTRDCLRVLLKPSLREKAVSFSRENFDYKCNAERYADLYKSLIGAQCG